MISDFLSGLERFGPWGPVVFIAIYIVATIAFLPGALLTMAAGALFGLWRGVALAFTGAVLGSTAAFALARSLARRPVARWVARHARLSAISTAVASRGPTIVLLLRLSPVFPFNALNYALGVSPIRFRDYLIGSIGMLPGAFLYTYYGKVIGDVAALAAGAAPERGPAYYVLLTAGLLATIAVTIVVTRGARRAIEQQRLDR
jgi:uncharacterized membrane protein YdjX (TVP38/TMEM64 family)